MKDMSAAIGGKKGDKLGPNGELAALKDECFSVTAGKQICEVCLFQKAHQDNRDDSKGGGTDLGRWKGMEFDEESGQRILHWEGGAECSNGDL